MKKILFALTLTLTFSSSFSQSFIDFGPKFIIGPNLLMNSESLDSKSRHDVKPASFGFGGGFKLAFDFNESVAIVGEFVYMSHNQKYSVTDTINGADEKWDKKLSYTAIEIPILLRYNGKTMSYLEAGYVISLTSNFSETIGGPYQELAVSDVSSQYASKNGGLLLGFGSYIWGKDNFGISGGLRVRYDLDDILTNADPKIINSPNYGLDDQITGKTNPFSIMLVIEFNFDLGFYMAKSPCNGRRQLIIGN